MSFFGFFVSLRRLLLPLAMTSSCHVVLRLQAKCALDVSRVSLANEDSGNRNGGVSRMWPARGFGGAAS